MPGVRLDAPGIAGRLLASLKNVACNIRSNNEGKAMKRFSALNRIGRHQYLRHIPAAPGRNPNRRRPVIDDAHGNQRRIRSREVVWRFGGRRRPSQQGRFAWRAGAMAAFLRRTEQLHTATLQPFLIRNLPQGWYLRSTGIWTFELQRNNYYIPVGLTVSSPAMHRRA